MVFTSHRTNPPVTQAITNLPIMAEHINIGKRNRINKPFSFVCPGKIK